MTDPGERSIIRPLLINLGMPVWVGGISGTVVDIVSSQEVMVREKGGGRYLRAKVTDLRSMEDPRFTSPPDEGKSVDEDILTISEERLASAQKRYGAILPLLNGQGGKETLQTLADSVGVSIGTIYRWRDQYEKGGRKLTALLPRIHERGPAGQNRLHPELDELIWEEIHLETHGYRRKPKAAKVLREVRRKAKPRNLPKVGYKAVQNRIRQIPEFALIQHTKGLKEAQRAFAIHHGPHPSVAAPLDELQIDHCLSNVMIVSDESRLPISRAWVTFGIDVYSRMITGFYATMDEPSVVSVALCLAHCVCEKTAWLKKHGVDKPWPSYGVMSMVYADHGKDFEAKPIKWACDRYGIVMQWRPVKTPHFGGHIERLIGTFKRDLEDYFGKVDPAKRGRGSYDEKMAFMTLDEFNRFLTLYITGVYNVRFHRGINGVPQKMWELGIMGSPDKPGRGLPPVIEDEGRFVKDFLPIVNRKVGEYGVTIDKVTYFDPVIRGLADYRGSGSGPKEKLVRFRRDPRDISIIYFYSEFDGAYVPIPYRNPTHPPVSLYELKWARRRLKELGVHEVNEDLIFQAIGDLRSMCAESQHKTKSARRFLARRKQHEKADPHGKQAEAEVKAEVEATPSPVDKAWEDLFQEPIVPYRVVR